VLDSLEKKRFLGLRTTTGNNGDTPSVSTPAGSLSTDL
jgi:hypothetical protein